MVFRMNQANPLHARKSGILLHPTSLPSNAGFGDLGVKAFEFVDLLASSGQSWWQMLPVCPADETGSPYVSSSTFAGNPLLISLARLAEDGLLSAKELEGRSPDEGEIEPAQALEIHKSLLAEAFEAFSNDGGARCGIYGVLRGARGLAGRLREVPCVQARLRRLAVVGVARECGA